MSKAFVLDTKKRPLTPCHPAKARMLLKTGKAAVFRRYPFTIILKREVAEPVLKPLRLKIDPGSKVTGLAIVNDVYGEVVFAAEVEHRGGRIKDALEARRAVRRGRRYRKTRYRKPRFLNRRRKDRWLPPSLESRIANIITWVNRLMRVCPVTALSQELVKFDTQLMQNPEVSGVEYQQGELEGYEVREYLLQKFGRKCTYCGAEDVPLEIEHIIPKSRGGSDRVSNLTLACHKCNDKKGSWTAEEFGYPEAQKLAKAPLKDAAAINSTRWELFNRLRRIGLEVETGTGGRTKFNRAVRRLPKAHWLDAACVGASTPETLRLEHVRPLVISATGHGRRQRCGTDRSGFPIRHASRAKKFMGWQTGDFAKALIPTGKYAGTYIGRVAIRFRPSFRLNGIDVHPKHLRLLQRADGYEYSQGGVTCAASPAALFL